jgi:hypothetical protein
LVSPEGGVVGSLAGAEMLKGRMLRRTPGYGQFCRLWSEFIRRERNFANRFAKISFGKSPRHNPLRMI